MGALVGKTLLLAGWLQAGLPATAATSGPPAHLHLALLGDDEPSPLPFDNWDDGTPQPPRARGSELNPSWVPVAPPAPPAPSLRDRLQLQRRELKGRRSGIDWAAPLVTASVGAVLLPIGIAAFNSERAPGPCSQTETFFGSSCTQTDPRLPGEYLTAIGGASLFAGVLLLIIDVVQQGDLSRQINALDAQLDAPDGPPAAAPPARQRTTLARF